MEIAIVLGALGLMIAGEVFNRRSIYGKAVVATANDRDAAGLMGIDIDKVIAAARFVAMAGSTPCDIMNCFAAFMR